MIETRADAGRGLCLLAVFCGPAGRRPKTFFVGRGTFVLPARLGTENI